jgi:hypothetical protein
MRVNKLILILLLSISLNLDASNNFLGSLGTVGTQYPDFGHNRPPQETLELFDDMIGYAYNNYSDAALAVRNILNIPRNGMKFRDIVYNGVTLIPYDENQDMIDQFYENMSRKNLAKIAKDNKVDIILYSMFFKTKLRRAIKTKENPAKLIYVIYAYDAQSSATKTKYIKFTVKDLLTDPLYDPIELQELFTKNYISIFQVILGHMSMIGSAYSASEVQEVDSTNSSSSDFTEKSSHENMKQKRQKEQIKAAEEAVDGDW